MSVIRVAPRPLAYARSLDEQLSASHALAVAKRRRRWLEVSSGFANILRLAPYGGAQRSLRDPLELIHSPEGVTCLSVWAERRGVLGHVTRSEIFGLARLTRGQFASVCRRVNNKM